EPPVGVEEAVELARHLADLRGGLLGERGRLELPADVVVVPGREGVLVADGLTVRRRLAPRRDAGRRRVDGRELLDDLVAVLSVGDERGVAREVPRLLRRL